MIKLICVVFLLWSTETSGAPTPPVDPVAEEPIVEVAPAAVERREAPVEFDPLDFMPSPDRSLEDIRVSPKEVDIFSARPR